MSYSKSVFIGDSLTYEIAKGYSTIEAVDARYKVGSGLAAKKVLDWQVYAEQFNFEDYDTVYVILGTNDHIQISDKEKYTSKVRHFIQTIKTTNQNVIWLLPPPLKDPAKNKLLDNTRQAIMTASQIEGINTLDTRTVLGETYRDAINGKQIRTKDGIHITPNGALLTVTQLLFK
ncbi:MAG: hypothetical protein KA732_12780 [Providencia sp.]|uniref:DUF459 domain-containing protein n=1 Tax=Providencia sp. TaxID=589 RepID=UPI001B59625F|nr:GDSL-type esterase/lipase family protein [Providencia sp.]MBP6082139.1 hypothetical protein [Providencia sp.]